MRILFASDCYSHLPENKGGIERNTHELCGILLKLGHSVGVLCTLQGKGLIGTAARIYLKMGLGEGMATDRYFGYPVFRAWHPTDVFESVIEKFQPDVIVVQSGVLALAIASARANLPTVFYIHSAFTRIEACNEITLTEKIKFVANSTFNAAYQKELSRINFDVVRPIVVRSHYEMEVDGNFVLQIGCSADKGAELTLKIAAHLRDISFVLVDNWTATRTNAMQIIRKASLLSNVTLRRARLDVRPLYARTRLLLVPSFCQEAWGRVVTEAQIAGIPVIASNRGGLPEAVGDGGIVLDPEGPFDEWVSAVRKLWSDTRYHDALANKARLRALQPDVSVARIVERFQIVLDEAVRLTETRS